MPQSHSPYQSLPFYSQELVTDMDCPLYSPTTNPPCFQIALSDNLSGDVVEAELLEHSTHTAYPLQGVEVHVFDNGQSYITYDGTILSGGRVDEGNYFVRLSINGIPFYYSHTLCMANRFNVQDWQPSITCIAFGGGGWAFQVNFDYDPLLPTEVEVSADGVNFTRIGTGTANGIPAQFLSLTYPTNRVVIRLKVWLNDAEYYKDYVYEFDPEKADPCASATLTYLKDGGEGYGKFVCLEWYNLYDIVNLQLMYASVQSQTYLQQYYAEAYTTLPTIITEDAFIETGTGNRLLDSVRIGRGYGIQFYGVPDPAIAALSTIPYHTIQNVRELCSGEIAAGRAATLQFSATDDAPCATATLTIELDRTLVGCQENLTELV